MILYTRNYKEVKSWVHITFFTEGDDWFHYMENDCYHERKKVDFQAISLLTDRGDAIRSVINRSLSPVPREGLS